MNTLTLPFTRHLWGALVALLAVAGFLITAPAAHATPANGWIWGGGADNFEGAAWFSMNASNANDPATDGLYFVDIPFGDGDITGYAWSGGTTASPESFYGWLSFNETTHSVASCSGKGNARRVGNTIVGAAIIVASAGSGGYDGCVVFDHGKGSVTIDPTTGTMSGYAYSSEYGWLSMSNVSIAPSGAKAGTLTGVNCSIAEGAPSCAPTLNWTVNEWVTGAELRDTSGPVHALVVPPVTGTFTVTPLASGVSKTFGLYGRSLAAPTMDVLQGGVTVTAFCNAPRLWLDGVCKTPAATGSITVRDVDTDADVTASPNCTIPVNGTLCSRKVSWTSTNATAPSIKRDGVTLSNNASGTLSPNPTFDGSGVSVTFAVYDGLSSLKTVQIKGVCDTGSSWQSGSCKPNVVPEGSISTTTCEVAIGQKECNATISWTTSSVTDPRIYENKESTGQVLKGWAASGSFTVNLSMKSDGTGQSAVYTLYNGTNLPANILKGPTSITATCANGSSYNPTLESCQSTALTATLRGLSTCEIEDGASVCASVPLTWGLSGVFGTATVKVLVENTYAPSPEYGSEPVPTTLSGKTANFVNVVSFGTTSFKVVGWVNNDPREVDPVFEVKGSCRPGSQPTGGVCQPIPGPTADITVNDCVIAENASTCNTNVSWTVANVDSASTQAILRMNGVGFDGPYGDGTYNKNYSTSSPATVPATVSFQVVRQDSVTQLGDMKTMTIKCAGSGVWTGGRCQTVANTITANPANTCTITAVDGENCEVTLSWNTSASTPVLHIASTTSSVTSNELPVGNKTVRLVPGTYKFSILDGASEKAAVSNYQVVCANGLVWNEFPSAGNSQACVAAAKSEIAFDYEKLPRDYNSFCVISEESSECTVEITATVSGASQPVMYRKYVSESSYSKMIPRVSDSLARDASRTKTFPSVVIGYGETRFKIVDEDGDGDAVELGEEDITTSPADPAARTARAYCGSGLTFDFAANPPRCRNISGQR